MIIADFNIDAVSLDFAVRRRCVARFEDLDYSNLLDKAASLYALPENVGFRRPH